MKKWTSLALAAAVTVGAVTYLRLRRTSVVMMPGGGSPEENTGPG